MYEVSLLKQSRQKWYLIAILENNVTSQPCIQTNLGLCSSTFPPLSGNLDLRKESLSEDPNIYSSMPIP